MGNSDSKAAGSGSVKDNGKSASTMKKIQSLKEASNDAIDPRIAKYLVDRLQSEDREKSFTRIILTLPKIGDKFVKLQKAFEKFDSNSDGMIDKEELAGALEVLGSHTDTETVAKIFVSADVHANNGLNLKEFIISLSLAYLFGVIPVTQDGSVDTGVMTVADQRGIQEAFASGADMFLLFDEDASGQITLNEVESVLSSMGRSDRASKSKKKFSTGNDMSSLYLERFKEFDWDADGSITFTEFLFAFIGWTDIDELVDEQNEAEAEAQAEAEAAPAEAAADATETKEGTSEPAEAAEAKSEDAAPDS